MNTSMNKDKFNKVATHPVQSWEWGEFRKKMGNEVIRFDFGQITLHKIPLTKYKIGIFTKGPKPTQKMLATLKKFAQKEKDIIFIKIEPNFPKDKEVEKLFKKNKLKKGKSLFTPSTFIIDLTKKEEEIFKSFHPKARYNIRYAQKKGVKVKEDNSDLAFKKYLELMEETTKRQGFYAHTKKYHEMMWKILHKEMIKKGQTPIAHLLKAFYKDNILATWILFVWKDILYYPYGASTSSYKNLQASSLLMWEAIRFGKRLGLKEFDLWGKEPGKGFTRFKEGFNPKVKEFVGSWDLIAKPFWYKVYLALDKIRWFLLKSKIFFKR